MERLRIIGGVTPRLRHLHLARRLKIEHTCCQNQVHPNTLTDYQHTLHKHSHTHTRNSADTLEISVRSHPPNTHQPQHRPSITCLSHNTATITIMPQQEHAASRARAGKLTTSTITIERPETEIRGPNGDVQRL